MGAESAPPTVVVLPSGVGPRVSGGEILQVGEKPSGSHCKHNPPDVKSTRGVRLGNCNKQFHRRWAPASGS